MICKILKIRFINQLRLNLNIILIISVLLTNEAKRFKSIILILLKTKIFVLIII